MHINQVLNDLEFDLGTGWSEPILGVDDLTIRSNGNGDPQFMESYGLYYGPNLIATALRLDDLGVEIGVLLAAGAEAAADGEPARRLYR